MDRNVWRSSWLPWVGAPGCRGCLQATTGRRRTLTRFGSRSSTCSTCASDNVSRNGDQTAKGCSLLAQQTFCIYRRCVAQCLHAASRRGSGARGVPATPDAGSVITHRPKVGMHVKKTSGMRVVWSLVVAILALVVLAAPAVALADGRVALVVGNSTYTVQAGLGIQVREPSRRATAGSRESRPVVSSSSSGPGPLVGAGTTRSSSVNRMVHSTNWMPGARPAGGWSAPSMDDLTAARGLITPPCVNILQTGVRDRVDHGTRFLLNARDLYS